MAIVIIDSLEVDLITTYQVNSAVALDSRFVVGPSLTYTDKDLIIYKYPGLRIWDLNVDVPYIWNGSTWSAEAIVGSGINATGATLNYVPKFNDTSGNLINSDIFNGTANIGIGLTGSNLNLAQFSSLKGLQVAGNIGTKFGSFYGNGTNITTLNASNISSGSLALAIIYSNNVYTGVPYVLQSGAGNVVSWVLATTLTGLAESTNTINIVDSSSNAINYLTFTNGSGSAKTLNISASGLRYIPNVGQIQVLNGTNTIPTYSFINSTTTGMYYETNLLSFSNTGVKKMSVTTDGIAIYNTNGPQILFNSSAGDRVLWSKDSELYFRNNNTIPTGGLLPVDYKMLHLGNLVIGADSGLTTAGAISTENLVIKHATSAISNTSNIDNTVIQNLQFDTYGHVTSFSNKTISTLKTQIVYLNTWSKGSHYTIAHNIPLSATELISCRVDMKCLSAEGGYSVGDIVQAQSGGEDQDGSSDYNYGIAVQYKDLSNPNCTVLAGVRVYLQQGSGLGNGTFNITSAKWSIRIVFFYI